MMTIGDRDNLRARLERMPDHLSDELVRRIERDRVRGHRNPYRAPDDGACRRYDRPSDRSSMWRPAYVRDIEKIMHLPAYNRYAGKTQVFSFRSNDDLSASRPSRAAGGPYRTRYRPRPRFKLRPHRGDRARARPWSHAVRPCRRTLSQRGLSEADGALLSTTYTPFASWTSCTAATCPCRPSMAP